VFFDLMDVEEGRVPWVRQHGWAAGLLLLSILNPELEDPALRTGPRPRVALDGNKM